jgi:hypothetical protein
MCQKFSGPSGKEQETPLNKKNDGNTQILTISKIVDLCEYYACFLLFVLYLGCQGSFGFLIEGIKLWEGIKE